MDALKRALRLLFAAFRTVLRGFGLSFIVLVGIVAGIAAYAHHTFGPEEARVLAISQLQALLHREVTIERMVLTPRGLKLRGQLVKLTEVPAGYIFEVITKKVENDIRPREFFEDFPGWVLYVRDQPEQGKNSLRHRFRPWSPQSMPPNGACRQQLLSPWL